MSVPDDPSGPGSTPGDPVDPVDHVTPERITELLRAAGHAVTVARIHSEPVGTGQMGASHRVHLTFAGDAGDVPDTLVAKVAAGPVEKRAIASGSYRTEVAFYRDIAGTVAVRTPRCWASWINDDGSDFVLLLEDLAPRRQGDQIRGCTPAEAVVAAVNLAGLHGPRWCDPALAGDRGLNAMDDEQASVLGDVLVSMNALFVARFGDRLPPADRDVLERVPAVAGAWLLGRSERFAPVHGDYRLDNLLFAPDGTDVAVVDWQTVSLGLPARDLAFLCATGMDPEVRRSCEDDVVAAYHEALLTYGVTDHPLDQCRDDYAYAMLQAPLIIVFGWAVADATERGDTMFLTMTARACAAIRDHDPFARI